MPAAFGFGKGAHPPGLQQGRQRPAQSGAIGAHRRHAPFQQLADALGKHGQGDRVGVLAPVEAARPVAVLGAVAGIAHVLAAGPRGPMVLQGRRSDEPFPEHRQAGLVRPQQPFVPGADQQVGGEGLKIERFRADGLGAVQDQQRSHLPGPRTDGGHVEAITGGPVHGGNIDRGGVRVDGLQQAGAPAGRVAGAPGGFPWCVRRRHQPQLGARFGASGHPGINAAGKFPVRQNDVGPRPEGQVAGGDGHAVTGRRNHRHRVRRGVDQRPEARPQGFAKPMVFPRRQGAGSALPLQPVPSQRLGRLGQGRPRGAVEVAQVFGQGEQMALAGQHGREGWRCS